MQTLLRLECSPSGAAAYSTALGDAVERRWLSSAADRRVLRRNLAANPPPPITHAFTAGMREHQTAESARGVPAFAASEELIGELEATQALLIATPMHNFTVPAVLKLWLDQVARFGRSFQSTPEGKIGLLADRPTFVCIASGSPFSGEAARQPDFLTPYLRAILACIGIRNLTFFQAEGAARAPDEVMARVLGEIEALAIGEA